MSFLPFSCAAKKRDSEAVAEHSELYCDDDTSLKERLQRAEEVRDYSAALGNCVQYCHCVQHTDAQARDALSAENAELQARLAEANAKIQELQAHIGMIRQHTIGFILEQMNTLNPELVGSEV